MSFKNICGQFLSSFYRYNILDILLFLLPKKRDASSDLEKTIKMLLVGDYQFRLNKICHIWIIIDSSWYESCSCHRVSSSWYYHYLNLISVKCLCFLFYVALYYWNGPEWVNILKFEILGDFVVPQISIIKKLFSKLIGIIFSGSVLKLNSGLPLLAASYVRMITVVKALSLQ